MKGKLKDVKVTYLSLWVMKNAETSTIHVHCHPEMKKAKTSTIHVHCHPEMKKAETSTIHVHCYPEIKKLEPHYTRHLNYIRTKLNLVFTR